MVTEFVRFERVGTIGHISLDRPTALNALTTDMCRALKAQLERWAQDPGITAVVIDSTNERAFCAGGDIRALWNQATADRARAFFAAEYRLNAAIHAFPKPYVALMNGVVMGGGVGISVHGSHRIVAPSTALAMPETAIGFFPDVGASCFLLCCPGETGMYLGLTGARLGAADLLYTGLATHYLPDDSFAALRMRLFAGEPLDDALADLVRDADAPPWRARREVIDRIFCLSSVAAIIDALDREDSWAKDVADVLRKCSPTSLKLVFRELHRRGPDIRSCLAMEYRLAVRAVVGHDFQEGVRAVLVDKDRSPRWRPASLAEVTEADLNAYFAPLAEGDLSFP